MSLDMLFTKESVPFVYLLVLDEGLDAQPRMKKKILFLNLIQIYIIQLNFEMSSQPD